MQDHRHRNEGALFWRRGLYILYQKSSWARKSRHVNLNALSHLLVLPSIAAKMAIQHSWCMFYAYLYAVGVVISCATRGKNGCCCLLYCRFVIIDSVLNVIDSVLGVTGQLTRMLSIAEVLASWVGMSFDLQLGHSTCIRWRWATIMGKRMAPHLFDSYTLPLYREAHVSRMPRPTDPALTECVGGYKISHACYLRTTGMANVYNFYLRDQL